MAHHEHSNRETRSPGSFWTSRRSLVLFAFLAIGGTLLLTEHRAHVLGILPWLFLLACPLLHMFGHGGHGGHGRPGDQTGSDRQGSTGTLDASKGEKS